MRSHLSGILDSGRYRRLRRLKDTCQQSISYSWSRVRSLWSGLWSWRSGSRGYSGPGARGTITTPLATVTEVAECRLRIATLEDNLRETRAWLRALEHEVCGLRSTGIGTIVDIRRTAQERRDVAVDQEVSRDAD